MALTTREQAKDLAEQIYISLPKEKRTTPISGATLEAAAKRYLGYDASIPIEKYDFNRRFRVMNLKGLLSQEGYFSLSPDGLGYVMNLEKISKGI